MIPEMPFQPSLLGDALQEQVPKYPFDPEQGKAVQQRRWEHRVIGMLLKHYGLVGEAKSIAAMSRDSTGLARLTFEGFWHHHPDFPMWLTARKIPYVHETSWEDLKELTKTKIYKAFGAAEADAPDAFQEARSGLVFEWLHSPWTTAIVHNDYRGITDSGVAMFFRFQHIDQLMAIQSLESFLTSLKWTP